METTWDGLPIAPDNPRGAGVVVRRDSEFLLLHRHHHGPAYEGDWAWTSPSGARLPGEPVLTCATRELYEETGLSGLDLRPVDLSAGWAVFATSVPSGTGIAIDPEHDRYTWLTYEEALAKLAPQAVADNFQRGATLPLPHLAFRPMEHADLPTLQAWLAEPHVARWYPAPADVTAKYSERIGGTHRVKVHILLADGEPAGFFQHHASDVPGEAGMDYLIGRPDLVGRGIGTQAIWLYARDIMTDAAHVTADPIADNLASIRALEKAGFVRRGDLYALDRARIFGP